LQHRTTIHSLYYYQRYGTLLDWTSFGIHYSPHSFKELFYRKINIENVYIFVMTSSLNFSRLVIIQANRFCFLKKTSFLI